MGEPEEFWESRIKLLSPYRVDDKVIKMTENPDVKFLHCLPAYHDLNTAVGKMIWEKYGLDALEVTNDVFEGSASIVFDQAENRLHTIKAVMVAIIP
jgi:ornithine carbamoyltransferase